MLFITIVLVATVAVDGMAQEDVTPATPAVYPANFDSTVSPCQDFYKYVTGAWERRSTDYDLFSELATRARNVMTEHVLRPAVAQAATTSDPRTKLVGTFYGSCTNALHAEAAEREPIEPYLKQIKALKTKHDLFTLVVALDLDGIPTLFRLDAEPDRANTAQMVASIGPMPLTIVDRDFYLRADSLSGGYRVDFTREGGQLLQLLKDSVRTTPEDAADVLKIETAIARVSLSRVKLRDPRLSHHPMAFAEFAKLTPHFDWRAYFKAIGIVPPATLNVERPEALRVLDSLLVHVPLKTWQIFFRWKVLTNWAPYLNQETSGAYGGVSNLGGYHPGVRPYMCLNLVEKHLRDAAGPAYVKEAFSVEAKQRAVTMIKTIMSAMHDRITALTWMSEASKHTALAKLDSMRVKIGYPDQWQTYDGLTFSPTDFAGNMRTLKRWERRRDLSKIGRPRDRTEWEMAPFTVNAYYNPENNEIVFPAAILQPPFFDAAADDPSNYGAIGAVIGHELTHAFDDQGRRFDPQGNLRDWWTAADADAFTLRTQGLVTQYGSYIAAEGDTSHVNGKLTLGENIADLGGVSVAFDAMRKAVITSGATKVIDGMTPEQRFFISYANNWRAHFTAAQARRLVQVDPHSPPRVRVDGVVPNVPAFSHAFGCKIGDPMVHADDIRPTIW